MKKNTTTFSVAALALVAVLLMGMIFAARPPQQQTIAAQQPDGTLVTFPPETPRFPIDGTMPAWPTFPPPPTNTPTLSPVAPGTTLIVTKREDTDDGKCDADCSLREAIAVANVSQDTTITFAQGLTGVFSIRDTLPILTNVSIVSSLPKSTDIVLEMQRGVRTFDVENGASLFIDRVAFTQSNQEDDIVGGGGIRNLGTLHVRSSSFINNRNAWGGAIESRGSLIVEGTLFRDNYGGGALFIPEGTAQILNSTFYRDNERYSSEAVFATYASVEIVNSTFWLNSWGTRNIYGILPNISIKNSIFVVRKGSLPSCGTKPLTSGILNMGGNLLNSVDAECVMGETAIADPMLGPLVDNGGPTLTMALLPGSPAIGLGEACLPTDQRGYSGTTCDAGSFRGDATVPIGTPTN